MSDVIPAHRLRSLPTIILYSFLLMAILTTVLGTSFTWTDTCHPEAMSMSVCQHLLNQVWGTSSLGSFPGLAIFHYGKQLGSGKGLLVCLIWFFNIAGKDQSSLYQCNVENYPSDTAMFQENTIILIIQCILFSRCLFSDVITVVGYSITL